MDLKEVAGLCEGYSGSDLTELCKQAAYLPLRDFLAEERKAGMVPGAERVRGGKGRWGGRTEGKEPGREEKREV